VPQAAGTLRSFPRLYRDVVTFIDFSPVVCAFVLTSPSKNGELSVKRLVNFMFQTVFSFIAPLGEVDCKLRITEMQCGRCVE